MPNLEQQDSKQRASAEQRQELQVCNDGAIQAQKSDEVSSSFLPNVTYGSVLTTAFAAGKYGGEVAMDRVFPAILAERAREIVPGNGLISMILRGNVAQTTYTQTQKELEAYTSYAGYATGMLTAGVAAVCCYGYQLYCNRSQQGQLKGPEATTQQLQITDEEFEKEINEFVDLSDGDSDVRASRDEERERMFAY